MFERGNIYELERCPSTLENNLTKPGEVEDEHILRLSKFTFTIRELSHIYTKIHIQKYLKQHCNSKKRKQLTYSTVQGKINYSLFILRDYHAMVK